jgi:hypothetical protein
VRVERIRELIREVSARIRLLAAANDVCPDRHIAAGDIAPQNVEPFVPDVDLLVVCALEARAAELHNLHVVTEARPDDVVRNVRSVRNLSGEK